MSFIISSKNKFNKSVKHYVNYETFLREIKDINKWGKKTMFLDWNT